MQITERDVVELCLSKWPQAAEIHVQFHTHIVYNYSRGGMLPHDGVCVAAIEGSNVRKQFTAITPEDLFSRVEQNLADWKCLFDDLPTRMTLEQKRNHIPLE